FFEVGATPVVCTASNGPSCSFSVTVVDGTPPTLNCPSDIVATNDAGQCSAVVSFTPIADDNCGVATVSSDPPSGSTFPVGPTAVTVTAVDTAGNSNTCSFTVTVVDETPPTLNCPSDIVATNDDGQCVATVSFSLSAEDN